MPIGPGIISTVLADFGISLDPGKVDQIAIYTDLLVRWSRAINLTAVREPDEIIRRHFAESIYLTTFADLRGRLLDVGSGAGFPGVALKVARPDLIVVLLEPISKKRAFLKEVVRECGLSDVEISGVRVERFGLQHDSEFDCATMRAVGSFPTVLPATVKTLADSGRLYLWLTCEQVAVVRSVDLSNRLLEWAPPVQIPLSRDRVILSGSRRSGSLSRGE